MVWIVLLLPAEVGWKVAVILQDQAALLMLALRVDILSDTSIDTTKVHNRSIKAYMRPLYIAL